MQPDLLSWVPPEIYHDRDGVTFNHDRDFDRLNAQAKRVYLAMRSGKWMTLSMIATITGDPEASVSARFRDFKKIGIKTDKAYAGCGLWQYRIEV